jgi:uncharacterized protein YndB with AHSA1/START domain
MATIKNSSSPVTSDRELVITRIFDAPRELIWKAWSQPEQVKRWHGPRIFTCPTAKIDFRVGGKYLFCMRSDSGPEIWQNGLWSTGVYKEIVPMERLVCTDSFADEEGNVVPATYYDMSADFPLEMLVTVTFEEVEDNKTKITLIHSGMPTAEDLKGATQGWNESLDKLAEHLAASTGN